MPDYSAVYMLQEVKDSTAAYATLGKMNTTLPEQAKKAHEQFVQQGVNFDLPVTKKSTEVVTYAQGNRIYATVKCNFTIGGKQYTLSAQAVQVNGFWVVWDNILPHDQK